jgi:hypothetical protein
LPEYKIHLIGGENDEVANIVTSYLDVNFCQIQFEYRGRLIQESALDYFECLCKIRLQLEEEKLIPFCYGASLNVYPSGMGRDMGRGLKAYKSIIGKQSKIEDLVFIFDEGPDVIPSSVANQKAYFQEWLKSPRA